MPQVLMSGSVFVRCTGDIRCKVSCEERHSPSCPYFLLLTRFPSGGVQICEIIL